MKFNTLLLFLIVTLRSFSQDQVRFHFLCNQACKAIEEGMIDHAQILLKDAFSLKIPPRAADYLNMAKCYSQQNEADSTEKYIFLAIKRDPNIGRTVRVHNLWFEPIVGGVQWQEIVEITRENTSELPDSLAILYDQLWSIQLKYFAIQRKHRDKNGNSYRDSIMSEELQIEQSTLSDSIAPILDNFLLNTPISSINHPEIESLLTSFILQMKPSYLIERRGMFEELIAKGFYSPDLLESIYVVEYFGVEKNKIVLSKYDPNYFEYYNKYGTSMDTNMKFYRLYGSWGYDF